MANPQKEDGYSAIANEILEALARHRLAGRERQILDVVFRMTYGWRRRIAQISMGTFSRRTGIDRSTCHKIVKRLVRDRILIKVRDPRNPKRIGYRFQKNYDLWKKCGHVDN